MFKRDDFRYFEMEEGGDTFWIADDVWRADTDRAKREVHISTCTLFQTVDVAISSKDTADYTVVATFALTKAKDLLVLDVQRRHFEDRAIDDFLASQNEAYGRPPMYVERFGAGRSPLHRLKERRYPVKEVPVEAGTQADKVTRAFVAAGDYERHAVFHPVYRPFRYPEWLDTFEQELTAFGPGTMHDDQVDTVSYACRLLTVLGPSEYVPKVSRRPLGAGMMTVRF